MLRTSQSQTTFIFWFSSLQKLDSTWLFKMTTTRSRLINKYLQTMFSVFYPYDCAHPHTHPHTDTHTYTFTSTNIIQKQHKERKMCFDKYKPSSFAMFQLVLNPETQLSKCMKTSKRFCHYEGFKFTGSQMQFCVDFRGYWSHTIATTNVKWFNLCFVLGKINIPST